MIKQTRWRQQWKKGVGIVEWVAAPTPEGERQALLWEPQVVADAEAQLAQRGGHGAGQPLTRHHIVTLLGSVTD